MLKIFNFYYYYEDEVLDFSDFAKMFSLPAKKSKKKV